MIEFDPARYTISRGRRSARLTPQGRTMLAMLCAARGAVVEREAIAAAIKSYHHKARSMDTMVAILRRTSRQIGQRLEIKAQHGVGYWMLEGQVIMKGENT